MAQRVPSTAVLARIGKRDPVECPVAVGSIGVVGMTPLWSWQADLVSEALRASAGALGNATHAVNTAGSPESETDFPASRHRSRTVGWIAPSPPCLDQLREWRVVALGSGHLQPQVVERGDVSQTAPVTAVKRGRSADHGLPLAFSEVSRPMDSSLTAPQVAVPPNASEASPPWDADGWDADGVRLLTLRMQLPYFPCTASRSARSRLHPVRPRRECVDSPEGALSTEYQRAMHTKLIQT